MTDKRTIEGVEIPTVKIIVERSDNQDQFKALIYKHNDIHPFASFEMAKTIHEIIFIRLLVKTVRNIKAEFNDVE